MRALSWLQIASWGLVAGALIWETNPSFFLLAYWGAVLLAWALCRLFGVRHPHLSLLFSQLFSGGYIAAMLSMLQHYGS